MSNGSKHFIALDALRGIAAFAVMFLHLHSRALLGYKPASELAVDFFFMLSGFVIAHAYSSKLASREMSFKQFAVIRLVRLYPMILFGALLGAASFLGEKHVWEVFGALVFALALIPVPRMKEPAESSYPLNISFWSLTFELATNFVFALLAPTLRGKRLGIAILVAFAALVGVVVKFGSVGINGAWQDQPFVFFRAWCPFLIGLGLYRFADRPAWDSHWIVPGLSLFLFGILMSPISSGAAELFCIVLVFPCLILLAARSRADGPLRALWTWLGAISYPLYALHAPMVFMLEDIRADAAAAGATYQIALFLSSSIGITLIAHLVLKLYDEPLRKWLRAKLRREPAKPAASPSSLVT